MRNGPIELQRHPDEWEPEPRVIGCPGPGEIFSRKAVSDMRILSDVFLVIQVDEIIHPKPRVSNLTEQNQPERDQRQGACGGHNLFRNGKRLLLLYPSSSEQNGPE